MLLKHLQILLLHKLPVKIRTTTHAAASQAVQAAAIRLALMVVAAIEKQNIYNKQKFWQLTSLVYSIVTAIN